MRYKLEVGARTVDDALAAERGGADRVELYASPLEGALTPSVGLVSATAQAVSHLQLFAMIRPRAGDFLYTEHEFQTMQRDADAVLEAGAHGIMSGVLTADGNLDLPRMKRLVDRAKEAGAKFTLHRAFDFSRDPLRTLEEAIDLGCDYVLTLGQEKEATMSLDTVRDIVDKAQERIRVVIALGANFDTAAELEDVMGRIGAHEYHIVNGYRTRASEMRWTGATHTESDYLKNTMFHIEYLSEGAVREIRNVFDRHEC
ncbi:MAG: copper homeostasis protein CutC [Lentisphaeria bacterium]|nr:copper homeostasis protein CutC [Lentisphaeria bacterium]